MEIQSSNPESGSIMEETQRNIDEILRLKQVVESRWGNFYVNPKSYLAYKL